VADAGKSSDILGVHAKLRLPDDVSHEVGHMFVQRWDEEQTSWASRRLGGGGVGHRGFIQPNNSDFARLGVKPYSETWTSESNLVTTAGWGRVLTLALAGGGTAYDATHTRVGIGTATAAASMTATDLSATTGSTAREWQLVTGVGTTGGATGSTAAQLTFIASFGTTNANFAWQEWGIDQGTASGYGASVGALLNRAVSAQGTKTSGQTWTATCTMSWT
jgi:hypothetical protein